MASSNNIAAKAAKATSFCKEPGEFFLNKAVLDRRLRPRCYHLGSYFKRPKSRPMRPPVCNWCYFAQFIAMPKVAHALRSVRRHVEQPWVTCKYDVIYKTGNT